MKANELSKYSKEEIINALDEFYDGLENARHKIARICEIQRMNYLFEESKKSIDKSEVASNKYSEWLKNMVKQYGSDGKVKLCDIPNDELQIGAQLGENYKTIEAEYSSIQKKIDLSLKI